MAPRTPLVVHEDIAAIGARFTAAGMTARAPFRKGQRVQLRPGLDAVLDIQSDTGTIMRVGPDRRFITVKSDRTGEVSAWHWTAWELLDETPHTATCFVSQADYERHWNGALMKGGLPPPPAPPAYSGPERRGGERRAPGHERRFDASQGRRYWTRRKTWRP